MVISFFFNYVSPAIWCMVLSNIMRGACMCDAKSVFIRSFFGMMTWECGPHDPFMTHMAGMYESMIILDLNLARSRLRKAIIAMETYTSKYGNRFRRSLSTPNNQPLRVFLSSPRYRIHVQECRGRESYCVWWPTSISKTQLTQLRLPA